MALKSTLAVVILIIVAAGTYFALSERAANQQESLENLRLRSVELPVPPRRMTLTNDSATDLKIYFFAADDLLYQKPLADWELKKGHSRTYPRGSYRFLVAAAGSDRELLRTEPLWTDLTVTGGLDQLTVDGAGKPAVSIKNARDVAVKVCVYDNRDLTDPAPIECWQIAGQQSVAWPLAPVMFMLRAYDPAGGGEPVLTRRNLHELSEITLY